MHYFGYNSEILPACDCKDKHVAGKEKLIVIRCSFWETCAQATLIEYAL